MKDYIWWLKKHCIMFPNSKREYVPFENYNCYPWRALQIWFKNYVLVGLQHLRKNVSIMAIIRKQFPIREVATSNPTEWTADILAILIFCIFCYIFLIYIIILSIYILSFTVCFFLGLCILDGNVLNLGESSFIAQTDGASPLLQQRWYRLIGLCSGQIL